MAVGGGSRRSVVSKYRLENTAHGALWRLTAGFGTDLKIMVSPVLISGPRHVQKSCKLQESEGSGFVAGAILLQPYCNQADTREYATDKSSPTIPKESCKLADLVDRIERVGI
jgi:hypothetical protein